MGHLRSKLAALCLSWLVKRGCIVRQGLVVGSKPYDPINQNGVHDDDFLWYIRVSKKFLRDQ